MTCTCFGGDPVGLQDQLVLAVADDDGAMIGPGLAGDVGRGQDCQQPVDLGHGVAGELLGGGEQDGRRVDAVLGLTQQVGGAELGARGVVGDYQGLRGPGEQVDADAAEELALGLGDVGVARADKHVDHAHALGAERHRADRLDAAEAVDLIRAGEVLGGDDGGRRPPLERWGAGDDARNARDLGRDDGHVGRGEEGIFAARHVAADRVHRDVLMAEDDAGPRLDLQIKQGAALVLGEGADLRLREVDIVDLAA